MITDIIIIAIIDVMIAQSPQTPSLASNSSFFQSTHTHTSTNLLVSGVRDFCLSVFQVAPH